MPREARKRVCADGAAVHDVDDDGDQITVCVEAPDGTAVKVVGKKASEREWCEYRDSFVQHTSVASLLIRRRGSTSFAPADLDRAWDEYCVALRDFGEWQAARAADLPLKASVTVELLMLLDDIQRKRAIECPTHDMCVNMLAQMVYVMQWCDGLRARDPSRSPPDA